MASFGSAKPLRSIGRSCDCGAQAFEAGDYPQAIASYQCAVTAEPHNPHLLASLGDAYLLDGQLLAAITFYRFANNTSPNLEESNSITDEHQAARDAAVEAAPEDVNAHFLRAAYLWTLALDDEALADYEAILEIEPDYAEVLALQGSSHAYLGDTAQAEVIWRQAMEVNSGNAHVPAFIAWTALNVGQEALVEEHFAQALALDPNDPYVLFALADSLDAVGDYEAEIEVLQAINLPLSPLTMAPTIRLGAAYLNLGDKVRAARWFDEAAEFGEDQPSILYDVAFAYAGIDDDAAAGYLYRYTRAIERERGSDKIIKIGDPLLIAIIRGRVFRLVFRADQGQALSLSVASSDTLDPLIVLLDPDGEAIAFSDDADPDNDDYSSLIEGWVAPADGLYTLVVTHAFLGSEGETEVLIVEE
ncbi:MAG: tetratricopeptide repeat protein [Chloroflexi bacterium]|nr:tetratricopeptide repeat protein [Chloroflexota bacterium]